MSEENPKSMGLGKLGDTHFKKVNRWTFQFKDKLEDGTYKESEPFFIFPLKKETKPDLTWVKDEEQRKKLQNQCFYLRFTSDCYGDATTKRLFQFVGEIYHLFDVESFDNLLKAVEKYEFLVTRYNGCGVEVEKQIMSGIFPISVTFGELDSTSSETTEVEVGLVYNEITTCIIDPMTGMTHFVKPNDIEETEINFLSNKTWAFGKNLNQQQPSE